MQTRIKHWDNAAAIRLWSRLLAKTGLDVSSKVSIRVQDNKVIVEPLDQEDKTIRLPFSEKELLDGLTADAAHADEVVQPLSSKTTDWC